jgi:general stress protein 26
MDKPKSRAEQFEKLKELTRDIQICMLTTVEPDGTLRSRPMQSQDTDENGDLWFFTSAQSGKVSETRSDPRVNLGFASGDRQRYVSVSGKATLVRDPVKAKELWKPILKAWFPGGLEDPNLALLRVSIEEAEYWDDKANRMVSFLRMVHSAVTGAEYEAEHGRLKA